jgi:hypothetical protein
VLRSNAQAQLRAVTQYGDTADASRWLTRSHMGLPRARRLQRTLAGRPVGARLRSQKWTTPTRRSEDYASDAWLRRSIEGDANSDRIFARPS